MEISDQERNALEQESTAANISSWVALGTRAITSFVACSGGEKTTYTQQSGLHFIYRELFFISYMLQTCVYHRVKVHIM